MDLLQSRLPAKRNSSKFRVNEFRRQPAQAVPVLKAPASTREQTAGQREARGGGCKIRASTAQPRGVFLARFLPPHQASEREFPVLVWYAFTARLITLDYVYEI